MANIWRTYTDNFNDSILIRSAWMKDDQLYLTPVVGGEIVEKVWINDQTEIAYRYPDAKYFNIFIVAGQSNANGYQSNTSQLTGAFSGLGTPITTVDYIYDVTVGSDNFITASYEDLQARPAPNLAQFGPELAFGNALVNSYGILNPVIVKVSEGGTSLHTDWAAPNGDLYVRLKNKLNQALALVPSGYRPRIRGFLWVQGENDSDNTTHANAYKANLQALLNDFKATYSAYGTAFMKTVVTRSLLNSTITTRDIEQNIVRLAQIQVAEEEENSSWITIDDFRLNDIGNTGSSGFGSHYLSNELCALGVRAAEAMFGGYDVYRYSFKNNAVSNFTTQSVSGTVGYALWEWRRYDTGGLVTSTTNPAPAQNGGVSTALSIGTYDAPVKAGFAYCYTAPISSPTPSAFILKAPITSIAPNASNKPITCGRLKKITWYQGHQQTPTAQTETHVLLKVNGNWIVSTTGYTNNTVPTGNDFANLAELKEHTISLSASNWRSYSYADNVAFSTSATAGSLLGVDLDENTIVTDFGFLLRDDDAVVGRIDHIKLYVLPDVEIQKIYNIYIMAGQSNMVGYDTSTAYLTGSDTALATPNSNIDFIYETSRVNDAEYETTSVFEDLKPRSIENPNEFGPELSFGRELRNTYGIQNIVIVKVAAGASGIYEHSTDRDWNVNTTGSDSIYERLKAKINEALALVPAGYVPRIRAFIWNQGERESNSTATPNVADTNAYKANLQAIISDLKATYAAYGTGDMKVCITRSLLQDPISTSGDNLNRSNTVRLAQIQVADEDPNGVWVSVDEFRLSGRYDGDAWNAAIIGNGNSHYLTPEFVKLGVRYAEAVSHTENLQTYRYQFVNNETATDIAVLAMTQPRRGTWTCRDYLGSAITGIVNASPGFFTVTREIDVRELYDSPKSIGTLNVGWPAADTTRRAYFFRDVIATLNPNNVNNPILAKNIKLFSLVMGNGNVNTAMRLVLKINGNWVISATPFVNTQLTSPGADFDFESEYLSLSFSRSTSAWLSFTNASDGVYVDGDSFKVDPSLYSNIGVDIGEDDVLEEVGFYAYSLVAPTGSSDQIFVRMNNIRIDTYR